MDGDKVTLQDTSCEQDGSSEPEDKMNYQLIDCTRWATNQNPSPRTYPLSEVRP